ncbi:MAG: hypothetical protein AB7P21_13590 [Lautropia sp.]
MTRTLACLFAVFALAACALGQAASGDAGASAGGAGATAGPGGGGTQDGALPEGRILARRAADCAAAGAQRGALSVRSRDALASVAKGAGVAPADLAAVLDWPVDYGTAESVVLVRAGALPNPAWTLAVDQDPVVVGDALVLSARIDRPPPGRMVVQMIASPCVFLHLSGAGYARVDVRWIERR